MSGEGDKSGLEIIRDMQQGTERRRVSFVTRLRNYFLAGIVVAAPVTITAYLIITIVRFIDSRIVPLIPSRFNPESYLTVSVPGLGVIVVLAGLTLLGALTANFIGRSLIRLGERVLARLPVVRNVYGALKQIFETVISQSSQSFKDVGLIEYPRRGIYSVVFITTKSKGEVQKRIEHEELISVFLPTTPNPTSGFLLFVPKKDVIVLDMTIEEAAKMIVSAGLVAPEWPRQGAEPEVDGGETPRLEPAETRS